MGQAKQDVLVSPFTILRTTTIKDFDSQDVIYFRLMVLTFEVCGETFGGERYTEVGLKPDSQHVKIKGTNRVFTLETD